MKRKFSIERLSSPEHSGDWHDKPARWIARCIDNVFTQKFSTKRDALLWRKVSGHALTFGEAVNAFLAQ